MFIDPSTEFGQRVLKRLEIERVVWFTTVRKDGMPQPAPVWFLWDEDHFLIYTRPGTQKLRNLETNPHAAVSLDSDGQGGNIIVFEGTAEVPPELPPADQVEAYKKKYQDGFKRINMAPDEFAQSYSVPIRFHPRKLRGH